MSSAILLAAIVAIWACALVPRWVRRAHEAALKQQAREGFETDEAYPVVEGYPADPGDDETYEETYQAQAYQAIDDEAQYDEAEYDEAEYDEAEIACQAETNYPLADDETRDVTEPDEPAARSAAASATVRTQPADRPQGRQPALPSRGARGRASVLRARRLTLTLLMLLVIVAISGRIAGLAHSWVVIPPALILGMYLLVLRSAGHADAENAARRAAAHAQAVARSRAAEAARSARAAEARERAREAAQTPVPQTPVPQPTAEVIDLAGHSANQVDQLYDQYEDATARAIGD